MIILSFFALVMLAGMLIYEYFSGRSMTTPVVTFGFLFLGILTMMELVWLALVAFWAVRLTVANWPSRWAFLPLLAGAAIISAHFSGMKFYGSPALHDNRPVFERALTLDHLELPNIMVASDGSRHALKGIRWVDKPELLSRENLEMRFSNVNWPVRFAPASALKFASGYAVEVRQLGFCGNSFYPVFFPRGIPRYIQKDAAVALQHFIAAPELAESH